QELAELLGHHRWVKRWLAGPYGIDHNALTVLVYMRHCHRERIGPAAARVNETEIRPHMDGRQQLASPWNDTTLDSLKRKTRADVFSDQTEPFRSCTFGVTFQLTLDERVAHGRIHSSRVRLPNEDLVVIFAVIFLVHVEQNADLGVTCRDAEELTRGNRAHCGTQCREDGGVGIYALVVPEGDLVSDAEDYRHAANRPVIACFDRDCNVVTEFDLIGAPCNDHLTQHRDVIDNAPAVIEDDFGLRLIDGENQNHAPLARGQIFFERAETGDKDAHDGRDEALSAPSANHRVDFLGSGRWRRNTPSAFVE